MAVMLLSGCAAHRSEWKQVWKEDFKGKTIDESVWSRIGKGPSDWNDMMSLRPDLAYVEDGQLVLWVNRTTTRERKQLPLSQVEYGALTRNRSVWQGSRFVRVSTMFRASGLRCG